jgi:hypothetical protein
LGDESYALSVLNVEESFFYKDSDGGGCTEMAYVRAHAYVRPINPSSLRQQAAQEIQGALPEIQEHLPEIVPY